MPNRGTIKNAEAGYAWVCPCDDYRKPHALQESGKSQTILDHLNTKQHRDSMKTPASRDILSFASSTQSNDESENKSKKTKNC